MNYIVVLVVILLLNLPSAVFGQLDEVCLTLPTDPNAHDDEQPRLVGVSLHLALDGLGQQNDEKLLSLQCPLNDDVNREEVEVLKAENEVLRAQKESLQAELVALHGDAVALQDDVEALQVENQSLRKELRDVLSGGLPINYIPRRQCDLEKDQLHVQMAVIQAEYEAEIQNLKLDITASQAALTACNAHLAAMEAACHVMARKQCQLSFDEPPPPVCQSYIEAVMSCYGG